MSHSVIIGVPYLAIGVIIDALMSHSVIIGVPYLVCHGIIIDVSLCAHYNGIQM